MSKSILNNVVFLDKEDVEKIYSAPAIEEVKDGFFSFLKTI